MKSTGCRVAQLGGALMIAGGAVDLGVRELLPHHRALLSAATGAAADEAASLVLALLHALGGALVAAGIAVLILLHYGWKNRDRLLFAAAGLVAVVAEGPNAWGILSTGSLLFLAPVSFVLLVVTGSVACIIQIPGHEQADATPAPRARSTA